MMLYDVVWCFMMLYDVIWCFMMLYDVVWYYMMLYERMNGVNTSCDIYIYFSLHPLLRKIVCKIQFQSSHENNLIPPLSSPPEPSSFPLPTPCHSTPSLVFYLCSQFWTPFQRIFCIILKLEHFITPYTAFNYSSFFRGEGGEEGGGFIFAKVCF